MIDLMQRHEIADARGLIAKPSLDSLDIVLDSYCAQRLIVHLRC